MALFFPPHIIFALLLLLPLGRDSNPEALSGLLSSLPPTALALHVDHGIIYTLSSLVESRPVVTTHANQISRSRQLASFSNINLHSETFTPDFNLSILRIYLLDHRGDRVHIYTHLMWKFHMLL